MAKNINTLVKYDQRRLWKLICIVNSFWSFINKIHKNLTFHWIIRIENGEISLWNKCFLKNMLDTNISSPREIPMSKISLKYIPVHIHNFEYSRVIMNMKLSSHDFLFHRNIKRRENKAQIPLIIHHNEKKRIIYFWCAAKDNWASQIIEVALRKELKQWKSPFAPSGQ